MGADLSIAGAFRGARVEDSRQPPAAAGTGDAETGHGDAETGPARERLRIQVLGPLAVHRAGEPVTIGPDMVRRLLALLALHPTRAVARDEIVAALWDGDPPSSATSLIHSYTSRLRKQLRGGVATGAAPQVAVAERGGYRLGLDAEAVDLTRFNRLVADGGRLAQEGQVHEAIDVYEAALRCWRGPLLADMEPRFGQLPAAVAVTQRRVAAATEYARWCIAAGRPGPAVELITEVARTAPLHEGLHTQLLLAQVGTGDRAAAVRSYTTIRKRLADELGVDPSAELQAAYLRLLREGDPAVTVHETTAPPPGQIADATTPETTATTPDAAATASETTATTPGTAATTQGVRPDAGAPGTAAGGRRRWPWRPVATAAAAALAVLAGLVIWGGQHRQAHRDGAQPSARPAGQADRPTGRSFTPVRSDGWVYGPTLGVSPGDDQWFSATVSGLGDHDHLAGARLRFNGDPDADNDDAGVLVAVCATGYVIEAADPDFVHEDTPLPASGQLRVTLTADNLLTIAFDGKVVVSRRLLGQYRNGRQIIPAAWQLTTGVSMTDIRTNAVPARITAGTPTGP